MLRFILSVLAFVLIQAALLGVLLRFCYDIGDANPLYAATAIKHRRLHDAPSPRVIFVGGSNLLFGIDSKMIEEQTDYHPVNMGLIGGLRLEYMLNEAAANARAGDLVVLSIEYNSMNAAPNDSNLEIVLGTASVRPANLMYLSWPQWKLLLDDQAMRYAGVVFRAALGNVAKRDEPRRRREREARPVLESVNTYGDLTRYHAPDARLPRNSNNQQTLGKMLPERVRANIDRINRFVRQCAQRDVRVVYAAPPVPRGEFERRRHVARQFDRALREQLAAPVILRPAAVVFPDDGFIGRSYHLHGDSVRARTQLLIDAILGKRVPATTTADEADSQPSAQPESDTQPDEVNDDLPFNEDP